VISLPELTSSNTTKSILNFFSMSIRTQTFCNLPLQLAFLLHTINFIWPSLLSRVTLPDHWWVPICRCSLFTFEMPTADVIDTDLTQSYSRNVVQLSSSARDIIRSTASASLLCPAIISLRTPYLCWFWVHEPYVP
jgi:hypothetical protein